MLCVCCVIHVMCCVTTSKCSARRHITPDCGEPLVNIHTFAISQNAQSHKFARQARTILSPTSPHLTKRPSCVCLLGGRVPSNFAKYAIRRTEGTRYQAVFVSLPFSSSPHETPS